LVKVVQEALAEKGYDPGPIDGLFGPLTQNALDAYQKANELDGGGHLTEETVEHMKIR
jgi:peptidoglycan hydrolase-like protein with peptidoglycan-binding domain